MTGWEQFVSEGSSALLFTFVPLAAAIAQPCVSLSAFRLPTGGYGLREVVHQWSRGSRNRSPVTCATPDDFDTYEFAGGADQKWLPQQ
jgi:hypothetical protein